MSIVLDRENKLSSSNILKYAKEKGLVLRIGFISIRRAKDFLDDITYRRINFWESKGLLTDVSRNKKVGWRKLSLMNILQLAIISDLRRFECSIKKIKTILNHLEKTSLFSPERDTSKAKSSLEYSLFSAWKGAKCLLLIDEQGMVSLSNKNKAMQSTNASSAVLILPFYKYANMLRKYEI